MALRALLVDAMGTLVALQPPAPRLRAELRARLGVEVTEGEARHALAAEIAYYRAHMQEGRDAASLRDLRGCCAEVLAQALPAHDRLARANRAELTDLLLASLNFEAYPDAAGALRAARAAGVAIVVVSNWDASLPEVLGRVGLGALVDAVVTSAAVGAPKPSPHVFTRALTLAGAPAAEALHVGDSLEEDVAGARAAGIPAVLLRRDGAAAPAGVPTISTLRELTGRGWVPTLDG